MKKIFFIASLFLCSSVFAQKNKPKELGFLLFDKDGNAVKSLERADMYDALTQVNDTTFVMKQYKKNGPMEWQQTFKDKDCTIPNGRFVWYDKNGNIDSTGIAINGRKDGIWSYYTHVPYSDKNGLTNEKDSLLQTKFFDLGKEISKEEYYNDTTENSAIKRSFFKVGKPISELTFDNDTTGRKPAEYPDGMKGWRNYLVKNLNSKVGLLIPQYSNLHKSMAVVTTSFLVGKDGSVEDVYISNSSGYPFDNEAARVIQNSGKWIPAYQDGKNVTYRQTQRIIFR